MAKLTEYPQATSFDEGDILIKDGTNGTKKITIEDLISSLGLAKVSRTLSLFNSSDGVTKITPTESNPVDMNNYNGPGVFRLESANGNSYITHGPYSSDSPGYGYESPAAFRLIVMRLSSIDTSGDINRLVQIVIPNTQGANTSPLAVRLLATGGWSPWLFFWTTGRIPNPPKEVGTYVLKATVTGSAVTQTTYSWVAEA